uniref:Uncharacterized protein n=1 Tax=Plectus sambesii TaxID=2011161 RepID=A0A914WZB7_9BILA
MVVIEEIVNAPKPARRCLPSQPPSDLPTDQTTPRTDVPPGLRPTDRPTLDLIDIYLTFHDQLSTGLEGHPIRAMRILLKMIKSQRFADKVHDYNISRTAGGAYGTSFPDFQESELPATDLPDLPATDLPATDLPDLPATARPVYDCSDPPCCSYSYSY